MPTLMNNGITSFVYGLEDPFDGYIKYVGQTTNLDQRYKQYITRPGTLKNKNVYLTWWLLHLYDNNNNPYMIVIDEITTYIQREVNLLEIKYIREFSNYCQLFNIMYNRNPVTPSTVPQSIFPDRRHWRITNNDGD